MSKQIVFIPLITGTPSLSVTTIAWRPSTLHERRRQITTEAQFMNCWLCFPNSKLAHSISPTQVTCASDFVVMAARTALAGRHGQKLPWVVFSVFLVLKRSKHSVLQELRTEFCLYCRRNMMMCILMCNPCERWSSSPPMLQHRGLVRRLDETLPVWRGQAPQVGVIRTHRPLGYGAGTD